jgi:hypothetical protein
MDISKILSNLTSLLLIIIACSLPFSQTVYAALPCPGELALAQKQVDLNSGLGTPCLLWMLAAVVDVIILLIAMLSGYNSLKGPRLKTLDGAQQSVDSQALAHPEYLPIISIMVPVMSLVLMNPLFGGSQWSIVVLALICIIACARRKYDNPCERLWWAAYLLFGSIFIHGVICIILASWNSISIATAWTLVPWICALFVGINVGILGCNKPTIRTINNDQPRNEREDEGQREQEDNDRTARAEPRHQRQGRRLTNKEAFHEMRNDLGFGRGKAGGRR